MSDETQQQKKLAKSAKPRAVQSGAQRGGVIDGATALPQVNLLPSSVRARRALQRIKVWLVIGLGVVLTAALLAYVFAMLSASSAEDELDEVRADTQRLLSEQAKYSEVPVILAQIEAARAAELVGMGNEVLWLEYFMSALDALPKDAQLAGFETMTQTPLMAAPLPADALVAPGLGTVRLTHRSDTVGDLSEWVRALEEVPGFDDVQYVTAVITEDDGDEFYETLTTAQVTAEALSGRLTGEEDQK